MQYANPIRWLLPLLLPMLFACTPSHTVQKTELYARKVGLTNQYEVSRWHNRRIPADSRLLVSISRSGDFETSELASAVTSPLSAYFTKVDSVPGQQPAPAARRDAVKGRYHFLLDVSLAEYGISEIEPMAKQQPDTAVDSQSPAGSTPGAAEQPPVTSRLSRVTLDISLIDVNSGQTIDKFHVVTHTGLIDLTGTDLDGLLAKPLSQLAKDLVGL